MEHLSKKRWIWLLLPLIALVILSGMLLASESQSSPQAQDDPTPEAEATAVNTETAEITATATVTPTAPTTVDYAMYFHSQVQDAEECFMTVVGDAVAFDQRVSNPAVTCPDAFSWKLFVEVIGDEFWLNWAADQYSWPEEPYPLCQADADDRSACCTPGSLENPGYDDPENPARHCPYFPGEHIAAGADPLILESNPPAVAQDPHHTSLVPPDDSDPGRVIRQEMAELVFRNEPMFDYIFDNNIYHTDGLAEVFARSQANLSDRAPYQQRNAPADLVKIDFPVEAIMVKSNWLHEERAAELGLTDDPDNPYITMEIESAVTDNNETIFEPGLHYLVAVHISSKDIPDWVWATFEHVNNPGRCDITGCNDSFGYFAPDEVAGDQYRNFTAPNTRSDDLLIPSTIFDLGKQYPGGVRSPELSTIFEDLEIGTTEQEEDALPSPADIGWLSYRLKGSQTNFTDTTGRETILGNSVTEAGFLNTSSCMTCHGRAAVTEEGTPALGVFLPSLSEDGYAEGSVGVPNPNWYFSSSTSPSLEALQTDFVWGILFANPLATDESADE